MPQGHVEYHGLRWTYNRKEMHYVAKHRGGLTYYIFRIKKRNSFFFAAERRWRRAGMNFKNEERYLGIYASRSTAECACEIDAISISDDVFADYFRWENDPKPRSR